MYIDIACIVILFWERLKAAAIAPTSDRDDNNNNKSNDNNVNNQFDVSDNT